MYELRSKPCLRSLTRALSTSHLLVALKVGNGKAIGGIFRLPLIVYSLGPSGSNPSLPGLTETAKL